MRTFAQKQNQPQKPVSSKFARPNKATPGSLHREHPILHLQRTIGNQAVQRMLQTRPEELKAGLSGTASPHFGHDFSRVPVHPHATGPIQTKLAINKPGDEYEQEADRVTDQVMRMPDPCIQRTCPCGGGCPRCQEGQDTGKHIQTKRIEANDAGENEAPPIVHGVLRSPGQPLDEGARLFFEQRFGHDFSNVRVHTDAQASASAQSMDASAFTLGRDIVFGAGPYAPDTTGGRQLLAHELTHVVQQAGHATATQTLQRQQSGASRSKNTPVGKISYGFEQKVVDQYLWPNALVSMEWVKSVPIGREVWDQLEHGGELLTIVYVAERKDIPVKGADTLGYYEESTGTVYVLAGQEDYYMEPTATGAIQKMRIISRSVEDISNTLFHELLHAWFGMMFPNGGTGHKAGATPIGDPKFDRTGYDPVFLERLERFKREYERLKEKLKRPRPRIQEYHHVFR